MGHPDAMVVAVSHPGDPFLTLSTVATAAPSLGHGPAFLLRLGPVAELGTPGDRVQVGEELLFFRAHRTHLGSGVVIREWACCTAPTPPPRGLALLCLGADPEAIAFTLGHLGCPDPGPAQDRAHLSRWTVSHHPIPTAHHSLPRGRESIDAPPGLSVVAP